MFPVSSEHQNSWRLDEQESSQLKNQIPLSFLRCPFAKWTNHITKCRCIWPLVLCSMSMEYWPNRLPRLMARRSVWGMKIRKGDTQHTLNCHELCLCLYASKERHKLQGLHISSQIRDFNIEVCLQYLPLTMRDMHRISQLISTFIYIRQGTKNSYKWQEKYLKERRVQCKLSKNE